MNGQGHFAADRAWFRAYWTAFAVMLVVLTYALWRRGAAGRLRVRLRALPRRLAGRAGWRRRRPRADARRGGRLHLLQHQRPERVPHPARRRASVPRSYEKALLGFEKVPQPRIIDVELNVEIYPRRAARRRPPGATRSRTETGCRFGEIHVRWARDTDLQRLDLPGARLRQEFAGLQLPDLRRSSRRSTAGARARDAIRDRARAARLPQRPQPGRHRRQRHVPQQHADRAVPRNGTRRAAAGSRQAPEVRPAAGAAPAQARGRRRPRQPLSPARQRLGDRRHHRLDRRRSAGRSRPG